MLYKNKKHGSILVHGLAYPFIIHPPLLSKPRPGGSVVSVSDSWPDGCEFETQWLSRNFFLSPLLKHVRKIVGGFGKKFVLVLV